MEVTLVGMKSKVHFGQWTGSRGMCDWEISYLPIFSYIVGIDFQADEKGLGPNYTRTVWKSSGRMKPTGVLTMFHNQPHFLSR